MTSSYPSVSGPQPNLKPLGGTRPMAEPSVSVGRPEEKERLVVFFSFVLDNGGARRRYLFLRRYRSTRYQIS
jgi:hypothetical protein